jgi:asparagine synthase (glutamine-hydrolysing)
MCGIATIFAYTSDALPVDQEELLRIRERMVPRGPDGCGLWLSADNRIGLAHRRLAIIDLSESGSQPMATADGNLVVTYNGEIYNYRELRAGLENKGYRFRSSSDSEVLLYLYADRGAEMVQHLRGMYAFAIWDSRRRGLFLARDPFGIKPLYLADDGATLRVASQVKALLAGGQIDTSHEPAGHVGFFLWGHVPEPYTLYRGIRSLPAGTSLWIETGGRRREQPFCSIRSELAQASHHPSESLDSFQVVQKVREALLESVRKHLQADVPVGVFLSAGLDSTILASLVSQLAPQDLNTVTLGFEEYSGTVNDEVPLAEQTAALFGARHRTIRVKRSDFRDELPRILDSMDQPSIDGVNSYFVSLAAARAGLKVAISGLGGDELFGSYSSFREIPRLVRLCKGFGQLPGLARGLRRMSAPLLKHVTSPKYAGLFEYGGSYGGAYLLRRGVFMPWELSGVLDPEMGREGWAELQTIERLDKTISDVSTNHLKISALEMSWYMRNQLLRDTDWASMAHSLEVRVPFLDLDLLRIVAPLLGRQGSPDKRTVTAALSTGLPAEIINRKKTGFSVPVREWLLDGSSATHERGMRGWLRYVYQSSLAPAPRLN